MEYKIMVHTKRREEGIFWCIVDENESNCGFGYAPTMVSAFNKAQVELRRLMPVFDNIEEAKG